LVIPLIGLSHAFEALHVVNI